MLYIVYGDEPGYKGSIYGIYSDFNIAVKKTCSLAKTRKNFKIGENCQDNVDKGIPVIFGFLDGNSQNGRVLLVGLPLDKEICFEIE